MQEIVEAALSCLLCLLAGGAGLLLRGRLAERHRDRDTVEFLRLVVGSLVTFLAIVMGLLTASSKQHFDQVSVSYRHLAVRLVQLDNELREVGAEAEPVRAEMRSYLAAVIFSTWPDEPKPGGTFLTHLESGQKEGVALTALLRRVELQLRELQHAPGTQPQAVVAALRQFADFSDARWTVIETAHPTIPIPFYNLMRFWAAVIFFGFGLSAQRNLVVATTMLISAISLASVTYVILELDDPLGGLITISSHPLRDALADIDRP